MKNKLFKITLLLTLLGFSVVWAESEEGDDFWYNTNVAIDLGFGLPYGYGLQDKLKDNYKIGNQSADLHFSPNIHIGILGSHDFNLTDTLSIGPEIGICYGFTRRAEIKNRGIAFAEKYIIFPLYFRITRYTEPTGFLVSTSIVVGYDFNIFLSSPYAQTGSHADINPSFTGNKNLYESIKDLPRLSGSIVLGSEFEFPKGFYVSAKFKVPIELFGAIKEKSTHSEGLDATYVNRVRALTANLVEFSVGLDIMRLIED